MLLVVCLAVLCASSAGFDTSGWSDGQVQWAQDLWREQLGGRQLVARPQENRQLRADAQEAMPKGPPCQPFSKEILEKHAVKGTVMVMCIDRVLFKRFAHSWVAAVKEAGISYWLIAAMDPWASLALGAMGVTQCFNAPVEGPKSTDAKYKWGDHRWHKMTWAKVHVMKAVYDQGYNIIHSDADTTWWNDPLPWFHKEVPAWNLNLIFSTDSLNTMNFFGDMGPEISTTPFFNINTGVYYMSQFPGGQEFFAKWLELEKKDIGHDQDGLNMLVRGFNYRGNKELPHASYHTETRVVFAALHNTTRVGLLPCHLFGNAYNIGRVHERLNSTLYVTHWVWTGGSPESKIQHIRDAMKYMDAPQWYGLPAVSDTDNVLYEFTEHPPPRGDELLMLLSMDLGSDLPMPAGYNDWRLEQTEDMIQFHLKAAKYQIQQAYWGLLAAAGLGRTFILPAFKCYCTKNWYMTQACRINGERHTNFPYYCPLSDFFRAGKVLAGIEIPLSATQKKTIHIRERNFLKHPRVSKDILASRLVIRLAKGPQHPPDTAPPPKSYTGLKTHTLPDGSKAVDAPWPLAVEELSQLINTVEGGPWRVVHLQEAPLLLARGFNDTQMWAAFDVNIDKYKTYWCCRGPEDAKKFNRPHKETYQIVPDHRRAGREPWMSEKAAG